VDGKCTKASARSALAQVAKLRRARVFFLIRLFGFQVVFAWEMQRSRGPKVIKKHVKSRAKVIKKPGATGEVMSAQNAGFSKLHLEKKKRKNNSKKLGTKLGTVRAPPCSTACRHEFGARIWRNPGTKLENCRHGLVDFPALFWPLF
jgi:hypothetical protein